jgi:hypothetical protein
VVDEDEDEDVSSVSKPHSKAGYGESEQSRYPNIYYSPRPTNVFGS